jgi:hypothetical protein
MSKVIYVCARNRPMGQHDTIRLREICGNLSPAILSPSGSNRVSVTGQLAFGIVNDNPCVTQQGDSLLLGLLYENATNWSKPDSGSPDGSFAIFRSNHDYCEIVSDPVGSRTIWYYFDDELFVSSTSQRAILMFFGSFTADEGAFPWILSTGSLGPEHSWDKRLRRLDPDSSLLLDRQAWTLSKKSKKICFSEVERTKRQHQELLTEAIQTTIRSFEGVNLDLWALPLSGGYDSRALLCLLSELETVSGNLRTLTWGLEASIHANDNDAYVAQQLAQHFGVDHRYFHTDVSSEPIEILIDRFLVLGEGRIDHIAGYMDGFQIWKRLFQSGIKGILRGDEGFGWNEVSSEIGVRRSIGCALCEDFANLEHGLEQFEFAPQALPDELAKLQAESLPQWRDRLYHGYRVPTILAALSDLKLGFVEQVSPLLSRQILDRVRELPDELRTDKTLFKSIVDQIGPRIPYARRAATAPAEDILKRPDVVQLMKARIDSASARELLGEKFVLFTLSGMRTNGEKSSNRSRSHVALLKRLTSGIVKARLQRLRPKPQLDPNVLAFRVFVILRMNEILQQDAMSCRSTAQV